MDYMEMVFEKDNELKQGLFPDGLRQAIRREMRRVKYRARDAKDSRSNVWSGIRCILPHPEEGCAIEEHVLWVYVFRTAAEAILFSTYDQNPRVLNAMCQMVDTMLDGEPIHQEDFEDYTLAEGAALDHYGARFDADLYRLTAPVESDEIDEAFKSILKK